MDDNYIPEEEYQQRLDEVRERDPNLYEYIMWGNNPNEPFDYDAMEVRLLLAVKEQEEGQKQSVGDFSKMTAMEIAERILAQYGMGQEVYVSGKEIADAMRYNPAKITMSGAASYERKEIAPGRFINVRTAVPFTTAWYMTNESVSGDGTAATKEPSSGVDGEVLAIDDAGYVDVRSEWPTIKTAAIGSAIGWKELEAAREDRAFQEQTEENARKITDVFEITPEMLGIHSVVSTSQKVAVEIQRQEICIELLVGHQEMEKHRYELRERAASCAAHCFHANGYAEYYDMVYRLCAEGHSLEQALYGYKK